MWIIRRLDQGGGFLQPSGSEKAFTKSRETARKFATFAEALDERCTENEEPEEY